MSVKQEDEVVTRRRGRQRLWEVVAKQIANPTAATSSRLDEILAEEEESLVRELKKKRLEEIMLERELRIQELREKLEKKRGEQQITFAPQPGDGQSNPVVSLITTLAATGIPPERVNEILSKLDPRVLMMLSALQTRDPNVLLPLALVMAPTSQPKSQDTDALAKILDAYAKVLELAISKKEGGSNEVVKELLAELRDERLKRLEEKIEESRVDPINYIKYFKEAAEALGFTRPDAAISPELQVKLKELETKTKLELAKMNLEKWKAEKEAEQSEKKLRIISEYMLGPAMEKLAERIGTGFRNLGAELAEATSESEGEETITYVCPKCGYETTFTKSEIEGKRGYTCPNCGAKVLF